MYLYFGKKWRLADKGRNRKKLILEFRLKLSIEPGKV